MENSVIRVTTPGEWYGPDFCIDNKMMHEEPEFFGNEIFDVTKEEIVVDDISELKLTNINVNKHCSALLAKKVRSLIKTTLKHYSKVSNDVQTVTVRSNLLVEYMNDYQISIKFVIVYYTFVNHAVKLLSEISKGIELFTNSKAKNSYSAFAISVVGCKERDIVLIPVFNILEDTTIQEINNGPYPHHLLGSNSPLVYYNTNGVPDKIGDKDFKTALLEGSVVYNNGIIKPGKKH